MPPETSAPLVVVCSLVGQLMSAGAARRGFRRELVLPLVAGGVLGVPCGAWLLGQVSPAGFKLVLGMLLAIWCPLMLVSRRLPHITLGGCWGDAIAGWGGGLLGGLGGFSGPIPTLWCTLRGWDKDAQRAAIQSFNLCMHIVTLSIYLARGTVTAASLPLIAMAVPAMLVPALLGMRAYTRISPDAFRRVVLVMLAISGVAMLVSVAVGGR